MKKIILTFAVMTALGFTSCSSDDDGEVVNSLGCVELAENILSASSTYVADPSTANCNALRDALQAAIDGGCTSDVNQEQLDSLPCE